MRDLAGRLIYAREGERARIARELHDDLGQKLALLAIDVDGLARDARGGRAVADRARDITTDVYNLSHQLHPPKLETLGLVAALQGLCHEVSAPTGGGGDARGPQGGRPEPSAR